MTDQSDTPAITSATTLEGHLVHITFYNPDNPGVVLSGKFSATAEVDLQTGEFVNGRGLPVHITIPGYGTALVRAGFWSHYPHGHLAGKDSFEDPEDLAAFCSYLSGD